MFPPSSMHQVDALTYFPCFIEIYFCYWKKNMAMGHHRPPLAIMHVNLSQQNSCYLQLDKSPNLLLSGKEPARVRISASVFSQSFYCLFFSECSKMDTSPFLFYLRRRVPFCPHLYYLHLKKEFIASAIVGVIPGLFQVHIRRPNTAV